MTEYTSVYTDFIDSELKTERERRTNLESRGSAVVTQSGALSTLLIAAAAFVQGSASLALSTFAFSMVFVSTIIFLGAGVLGIAISAPLLFKAQPVADEATMRMMLNEKRADPDSDAKIVVGTVRVGTLTALRAGNSLKVILLTAAQLCQVAALVFLLLAVLAAIMQQP